MNESADFDVVVVGAGPAGSAAAERLARQGWSVLLLDRARFPRPKPCGECVNPGGVEALRQLGVLGAVEARSPAVLGGWTVHTGGGRDARGRFEPGVGPGLGISREVLDQVLVEAAVTRGVSFDDGVRVQSVDPGDTNTMARVQLASRSGGRDPQVRARIVVAADGLRSVLARTLGILARAPLLRKVSLTCRVQGTGPDRTGGFLFLGRGLTVGVAPVHATAPLWNVTVVTDPGRARELADQRAAFLLRALASLPLHWDAPPRVLGGPWASGPFDWPTARSGVGRVLFAGDAAGYYDPLTGQGIYRALRSAELVAETADRVLRGDLSAERAPTRHGRALRRAFAPGRRVQRLVEAVVSSGPSREFAVRHLSSPGRLDALIRVTGDAAPIRSLFNPALWLTPWGASASSPRNAHDHH